MKIIIIIEIPDNFTIETTADNSQNNIDYWYNVVGDAIAKYSLIKPGSEIPSPNMVTVVRTAIIQLVNNHSDSPGHLSGVIITHEDNNDEDEDDMPTASAPIGFLDDDSTVS